ncbi:rho GTPase-activating protein SYDE1 [Poecilia formosa]|uniref:rho GTPase-activating protein SYDE1 n=1 Tax=Poecilia formosa TaxID=48698 RepID=UPI0004440418|nr:PREDICTED: rho GTPase-activating protein SYDE1 [Poecilia formosa]
MAEPLLRRTFSRLRGKDRRRRKTEPKLSEPPVSSAAIQTSPSSPSLNIISSTVTTTHSGPSSPPRNHITVAKKQQWVRQEASCPNSTHMTSDQWSSWISHHESGLTWTDKAHAEAVPLRDAVTSIQQEDSQASGGATEIPTPGVSGKLFGQRAYLQSLERSSRAWVLSSGKSQAPDDEFGPLEENSSSNIWYNPIPEEEDGGGPPTEEEVWKRRDEEQEVADLRGYGCSCDCPQEGANPSVSHQVHDIREEISDCPASDSSPTSLNKGGGAGSVMDRLRSPGTVRKLSLKMKKLPELRRKLSLRSSSRTNRQTGGGGGDEPTNNNAASSPVLANQNVISRYHLDSSAPPARPHRRSSRQRSTSKGGYLSDGDSPELLPRQQAADLTASQEAWCDVSSFQLYVGSDPPRCSQRVTGLLTVHLLGLEEMKSSRSEDSKEIFLAIQVDGVTRARTALLNLRGHTRPLNHTFHLDLERARQLRIVVLTPAAPSVVGGAKPDQSNSAGGPNRNRVCCLGGVSIPPLFKGSRSQQLCLKLEPRGLLYVKLTLQEKWDTQHGRDPSAPANVFGVELHHLVEKEGNAAPVPLLIQKTVAEIERRGLKVVGLYRLCGSAAVKKELRDGFEKNSSAVCLSEDRYPDVNVITGVLKDYLRELPSPLITRTLYQVVREAMTLRPPLETPDPEAAQCTVRLLSCLPEPEKATLSVLLDHLSLVASFSSFNRMTHQNLAVCFGPVLLTPTQEARRAAGWGGRGKTLCPGEEMANAVDFKRHIEALHYLLQLWPVPINRVPEDDPSPPRSPSIARHLQVEPCPQHRPLWLPGADGVVSRRGRGGPARLESPPPVNRYAGDWTVCGPDLPAEDEADYDEVAGSESEGGSREEEEEEEQKEAWPPGATGGGHFIDDFMDFDAPFNCRLSLKDFDTLIHDLDRELAKQINICL